MAKGALDIFLIYQFLKKLVKPFNEWDAFKSGVIDAEGKVITDKQNRTLEQDMTWGYYDRLIANLKKLLGKIPGGKTRLASFAAALLLIKENNIDPDDLEYLEERLTVYMEEARLLQEDAPTNAVGGGAIASVGVGPDGEPPGIPAKKKKKLDKINALIDRKGGK